MVMSTDNKYARRIEALRAMMRSKDWDAVVIMAGDPHSSEYPSERYRQCEYLTGFTGEAADMVVTLDHAGLWTDSRFFIQAVTQLEGTGVVLHKKGVGGEADIAGWLASEFSPEEAVIVVDGECTSVGAASSLGMEVVSVPNLLDRIWEDRPSVPQSPIYMIESGMGRQEKIERVRNAMLDKGCSSILLSSLEDIAWCLNCRASDIDYNPVIISYLLITEDSIEWFVLKTDDCPYEQTLATASVLEGEGIGIRPYQDILYRASTFQGKMWIDPSSLNLELYSSLLSNSELSLYERKSPVEMMKAIKNDFEIKSIRQAMIKDGVAMENFIYWLEKSLEAGREIDEAEAAAKQKELRELSPEFRCESFKTISAYGKAGALPHYDTPDYNAPLLQDKGLYLFDSGAHYTLGSTDITRTVALGKCSQLEIEDYTLVLKAHISLAMAIFPEGTPGCRIDALAREALWRSKRNFYHGTGHGVGFMMGLHEGPQDIRQNLNPVPLMSGMVLSDEPGIYREGLHGVRHENLLLVRDAGHNEFGHWLEFEPLTLCHIDTSAIDRSLLTSEQIEWLNDYNRKVYTSLSPYLSSSVAEWLKGKTDAI